MKSVMNKTTLLWLSILLVGCQSEPEPFATTLAGFSITFPLTANELDTTVFFRPLYSSKYVDSTALTRIEWLFDARQDGKSDVYKLPDRRQAYGVNIYLKNKGPQIDSVKKALEKQFGKPMVPVVLSEINDESFDNNVGYTCPLNSNTHLFLRKTTSNQGDAWSQFTSLRIGIGYNLEKDQLERFATSDGNIHKDYD